MASRKLTGPDRQRAGPKVCCSHASNKPVTARRRAGAAAHVLSAEQVAGLAARQEAATACRLRVSRPRVGGVAVAGSRYPTAAASPAGLAPISRRNLSIAAGMSIPCGALTSAAPSRDCRSGAIAGLERGAGPLYPPPASAFLTSSLTVLPSARPRISGIRTFITLPMSAGPAAPVAATASRTA